MNPTLQLFTFVGGVALLLYGMRVIADGLQQAAGARIRTWLHRLTRNRISGALVGTAITASMQSSSATTLLLVGLTSAGLLTFENTIGVLLGAGVGTTVTVQLIAFDILDWAPLMIAIGVAVVFIAGRRVNLYTGFGRTILGFGLIFQGMQFIVVATEPLGDNPVFVDLIRDLTGAPILLLLISLGLTAIMQSSAATIGMAIGLSVNGTLGLDAAIPLILGANIGTCSTALLASMGRGVESRRVAVAFTLLNVVGAAVAFPLASVLERVVAFTAADVSRQIANAHMFFNVAILVAFLPLTAPLAWMTRRLVPAPRRDITDDMERYLDPMMLQSPAVAIGQATRAVLRMAEIVQGMLGDVQRALESNDEALTLDIRERDDEVDRCQQQIRAYLTKLAADQRLDRDIASREVGLLNAVSDLENIGDVLDKNLAELVLKKIHGDHSFSREGGAELQEFHRRVSYEFARAVSALASGNTKLASDVILEKAELSKLERELRLRHIQRLHDGRTESIDSSDIHLDVLSNFKRINTHATNLAYVVWGWAADQARFRLQ